MIKILKTTICLIISTIIINASTYQKDDAAITAFANTQVNLTAQDVIENLDIYFQMYPQYANLIQGGVQASISMSPLPGQKGNIDQTLTLLRLAPTKNSAVAAAQYRYLFETIDNNMLDGKDTLIAEKDAMIATLNQQILQYQQAKHNMMNISEDQLTIIYSLLGSLSGADSSIAANLGNLKALNIKLSALAQ